MPLLKFAWLILPWLVACTGETAATPPATAILFVLDKSASMQPGFDDLKKACIAGARELDPADYVAVLACDDFPRWIVPFTHPGDEGTFVPLERLDAEGGTSLLTALTESLRGFQSLRADRPLRKRMVIISDGYTRPANFQKLVESLVKEGVSVSTVCISSPEYNLGLMSQLATWSRGRSYHPRTTTMVPKLLAQEIRLFKSE